VIGLLSAEVSDRLARRRVVSQLRSGGGRDYGAARRFVAVFGQPSVAVRGGGGLFAVGGAGMAVRL
jgi:hypothetical protein